MRCFALAPDDWYGHMQKAAHLKTSALVCSNALFASNYA